MKDHIIEISVVRSQSRSGKHTVRIINLPSGLRFHTLSDDCIMIEADLDAGRFNPKVVIRQ